MARPWFAWYTRKSESAVQRLVRFAIASFVLVQVRDDGFSVTFGHFLGSVTFGYVQCCSQSGLQ
jgi:hypothetical protein